MGRVILSTNLLWEKTLTLFSEAPRLVRNGDFIYHKSLNERKEDSKIPQHCMIITLKNKSNSPQTMYHQLTETELKYFLEKSIRTSETENDTPTAICSFAALKF
ncbi:hypothetical protein NPIL_667031 [Nephila pilipes]|uniref:Uncharacterized protein n=1 Tax=Nephila pilipes TaxID=299642 RepID=A0A8X6TZA7_NEPPI|nr:hypothetical protein NPIL_667031 [Nephila pilipes]